MHSIKYSFLLVTFLFSFKTFAVTEAFLLAEIVVNTARELEELEQLISQTQKHTQKLSEFADTIDDYSYRAERLKSWAEDLKDLNGENPKDLSEMNSLIRQIRLIEEDTSRLYVEYARKSIRNKMDIKRYKRIERGQKKNTRNYQKQALSCLLYTSPSPRD